MARNKQTPSTSRADPKTSTASHHFHFRDIHSNPKLFRCFIHFRRFRDLVYPSKDTSKNPDTVNNVSEPRTETSTNSGRYPILTSLISCTVLAGLYIVSFAISGVLAIELMARA